MSPPSDDELGRSDARLTDESKSAEVVYALDELVDDAGRVVAANEHGELTEELRVRAARPWQFRGERAVQSHAFDVEGGDGFRHRGYELVLGDVVPPRALDPDVPEIDPRLDARLHEAQSDEVLPVSFFLRDWPDWDVPLPPVPGSLSAEGLELAHHTRADAIAAREALVLVRSSPLREAIAAAGGHVESSGWGTGWIVAHVPAGRLVALLERDDVRRAALEDSVPKDASLTLGDAGVSSRAGTRDLGDFGYSGERPSGRNGYGDITIAVAETSGFEDEAKFLCDTGAGCPGDSRLCERFSCLDPNTSNLGSCDPVTDYPETNEGEHGTRAVSIALGDYTDGQCDGAYCGDSTMTHSSTWKQAASGVAREASLVYFSGLGGGYSAAFAEVFTDSVSLGVDMISLSLEPDSVCRVKTTSTAEAELETAYSDGIFVASCSGNGVDSGGACTITSPSGIPSAFTVGGLAQPSGVFEIACETYPDCIASSGDSRLGGGDVKDYQGTIRAGSQSMMDVVAPSRMVSVTNEANTFGEVSPSTTLGCSFATPFVAGAAAVQKDFFIARGDTWIHSPGRLHTVMLAMADRFKSGTFGTLVQRSTGTDKKWGMGRLRTRAFHAQGGLTPYGYEQLTASFTPGSLNWSASLNGGGPLPSGAAVLKCVMHQTELMDAKDRVSNIDLQVQTWAAVSGSCASPGVIATFDDASWDTQAMVSVSSGVGGKCAKVRMINSGVVSTGVTSHVFCYYAGVDDEYPN